MVIKRHRSTTIKTFACDNAALAASCITSSERHLNLPALLVDILAPRYYNISHISVCILLENYFIC